MTTSTKRPGRPKNKVSDPLAQPEAKGQRLKRARNLANLSREQLCEGSGINIHTLIGWEVGRFGGLTMVGAKQIIKRLAQEGVICSPEWLLYEIGIGPEVRTDFVKIQEAAAIIKTSSAIEDEKHIIDELMFFRKIHKNFSDYIIKDDGMLPHYQIGDYVAGNKRYKNKINEVIGLDCIVQTKDGRTFFRNLRRGPKEDSYCLVCSNSHADIKDVVYYDVELFSAAPVIWHRRKDPR